MDVSVRKKLIIAGIVFVLVIIITSIFVVINNQGNKEPFNENEVVAPPENNEPPATLIYVGFVNLERLGLTLPQRQYIEANITEFLKNSEASTAGEVVMDKSSLTSSTGVMTFSFTTPKGSVYALTVTYRGTGNTEVSIQNTAGEVVYTSPHTDEHLDDL